MNFSETLSLTILQILFFVLFYYQLVNPWKWLAWYYFVRTCILGWFAFPYLTRFPFGGAVKVLPAGGFILYS